MKIYYDVKYVEDSHGALDLISVGMVSEDGRRHLYAINRQVRQEWILANPELRKKIWPELPIVGGLKKGEMKKCRCASAPGTTEAVCACVHGKLDMDHPDVRSKGQIRYLLREFVLGNDPEILNREVELWTWFSAYPHVVLSQLWQYQDDLPEDWPKYSHSLHARCKVTPYSAKKVAELMGPSHNALVRAKYYLNIAESLDQSDDHSVSD